MKAREILIIVALAMLIGWTYAYMQQSDEEAAARERLVWAGKADK